MRVVSYVVLAVLGVAVSVAGAVVQDGWVPGGLILALAGSAALFYGGAKFTGGRVGAAVPTITWFATAIYLSVSRPEGDFLFSAGAGPYVYLLVGVAAGVVCSALSQYAPPGGRDTRARS